MQTEGGKSGGGAGNSGCGWVQTCGGKLGGVVSRQAVFNGMDGQGKSHTRFSYFFTSCDYSLSSMKPSAALQDLRHIEHFLVEVAEEARLRLSECSGQAISNLAWALATVDVLGHDSALGFVTEAACYATHRLSEFSPQAISNFCWALARVHVSHSSRVGSGSVPPRAVVREFMASAAVETSARMSEFAWRDLSGVIVALAHGRHKSPEASTFASILVSRAAAHCAELSTQVMLNIALSASRLGVHAEELHPMVEGIRQCTHRMNSFDMRQWAELQRKCRGRFSEFLRPCSRGVRPLRIALSTQVNATERGALVE